MLNQIENLNDLNEDEKVILTNFFFSEYREDNQSDNQFTRELAVNTINLVGAWDMIGVAKSKFFAGFMHSNEIKKFIAENYEAIIKFTDSVRKEEASKDNLPMFFAKKWLTSRYLNVETYQHVLDGTSTKREQEIFEALAASSVVDYCAKAIARTM